MEQGALVAIALFLLGQTGAFLWWAATITQASKDHGYRIERTETMATKTANEVAFIKGQRGIEL